MRLGRLLFEDKTEDYKESEVACKMQRIGMEKNRGQKGPRKNRCGSVALHKHVEYDRVLPRVVHRVSEICYGSSDGNVHRQ